MSCCEGRAENVRPGRKLTVALDLNYESPSAFVCCSRTLGVTVGSPGGGLRDRSAFSPIFRTVENTDLGADYADFQLYWSRRA